jgi:hypothetical protein
VLLRLGSQQAGRGDGGRWGLAKLDAERGSASSSAGGAEPVSPTDKGAKGEGKGGAGKGAQLTHPLRFHQPHPRLPPPAAPCAGPRVMLKRNMVEPGPAGPAQPGPVSGTRSAGETVESAWTRVRHGCGLGRDSVLGCRCHSPTSVRVGTPTRPSADRRLGCVIGPGPGPARRRSARSGPATARAAAGPDRLCYSAPRSTPLRTVGAGRPARKAGRATAAERGASRSGAAAARSARGSSAQKPAALGATTSARSEPGPAAGRIPGTGPAVPAGFAAGPRGAAVAGRHALRRPATAWPGPARSGPTHDSDAARPGAARRIRPRRRQGICRPPRAAPGTATDGRGREAIRGPARPAPAPHKDMVAVRGPIRVPQCVVVPAGPGRSVPFRSVPFRSGPGRAGPT